MTDQVSAWTPVTPLQVGDKLIVDGKVRGVCVAVLKSDDRISSRHLSRLSGVSSDKIRDWRRRGFIPKSKRLPRWWVDVVQTVDLAPKTLPALFKSAKEAHRP